MLAISLTSMAPACCRGHRDHAWATTTDLHEAAALYQLAQGFTLEDVKNLLEHSTIVLTSNTDGHIPEQRKREVARGMDAVLGG